MILKESIFDKEYDILYDPKHNMEDDDFRCYLCIKIIIDMMPAEDVHRFGLFLERLYQLDHGDDVYTAESLKALVRELGQENPDYYDDILYHLEQLGYESLDDELIDDPERQVQYADLYDLINDMSPEEQEDYVGRLNDALGVFDISDQDVSEAVTPYITANQRRAHAIHNRVRGQRFVGQKTAKVSGKPIKTLRKLRMQRPKSLALRRMSGLTIKSKRYVKKNKIRLKKRNAIISRLKDAGKWSSIGHKK